MSNEDTPQSWVVHMIQGDLYFDGPIKEVSQAELISGFSSLIFVDLEDETTVIVGSPGARHIKPANIEVESRTVDLRGLRSEDTHVKNANQVDLLVIGNDSGLLGFKSPRFKSREMAKNIVRIKDISHGQRVSFGTHNSSFDTVIRYEPRKQSLKS